MKLPNATGDRVFVLAGVIFLVLGGGGIVYNGASWSVGSQVLAGLLLIGAGYAPKR